MGLFQMSLINKMLQDLDARRSDVTGAGEYGSQIRAVPERGGVHAAWWVALVLGVILACVIAWMLLQPAPVPVAPQAAVQPQLPLKLDTDLAQNAPQLAAMQEQNEVAAPQVAAAAPPPETRKMDQTPQENAPDLPAARNVEKPALAADKPAPTVKPMAASAAKAKDAATASEPVAALNKQVRELSPQQRAENEYRRAISLIQQGKTSEAIARLEQALQLDPQHAAARQILVGLLLESKRHDDALRKTREGLNLDPAQAGLAMIQARLQLEKSELRPAIETLQRTLPHATERADYQAFLAALLQRDARNKEAVEHYLQALQRSPQNGVWWMGLGISLQAEGRGAEAQEAFSRAKASDSLSSELLAFVESKLKQLQR
jgi:MSHA biogenesis protein MshN